MWSVIFGLILAYLVGAIPSGYLIGKAKGLDVRLHGSNSIGFTNVKRILGWRLGLMTLLIDVSKAALFLWLITPILLPNNLQLMRVISGLLLILGNIFPIWLSFKGGKAVATGVGVFAVIFPVGLLIALALFFIALTVSKYLSIGSLSGVLGLLIVRIAEIAVNDEAFFSHDSWSLNVLITLTVGLIFFSHRQNIKRLFDGQENKFLIT